MVNPESDFVAFLEDAKRSGGSELANCQPFIERLCGHLDLPKPDFAAQANQYNDFVYERRIDFKHPDGSKTPGRIDLYKRGCFILEAKQSSKRTKASDSPGLFTEDELQTKHGQARRGTRSWDKVMVAARQQAVDYARALPIEHGYPPFLMIVDIGNVVEVFADFSGQGKNYAHFPDRQSYRLTMDDLLKPDIQDRIRAIWTDPLTLDPTRRSAEVTRDIAERLAKIAQRLEEKYNPKDVAEFLMRCLFTMFAEDIELLPGHAFEKLLDQMRETPENFVPALESLWQAMDEGGYAAGLNATVKRFNGTLFKNGKALPLDAGDINELWIAANRNWSEVEPAIFGTLLERALDTRERSKLGAHYTPRTYVERLVVPTIIEPLRDDWELISAQISELREQGKDRDALRAAQKFHRQLCSTRVLDPACGTGNFLYVSLELMKRLEGEVLETIEELGGQPSSYRDHPDEVKGRVGRMLTQTGGRFTVDPHQFFGLELNPRAVPIADLVLWIGYLKWQIRTGGPGSVTEPVLDAYGTIRQQDAILAYDEARTVYRDGKPVTRWDGVTRKTDPITGNEVPDPEARIELLEYVNPRKADWPEVEYIVGNPPFIGAKDMRGELGEGYAKACWAVRPNIPGGADFVMHFWDAAAERLVRKGTARQPNPLKRFGFITTNSITQTFSRRVIEKRMTGSERLSLIYSIPDHPWLKAVDKASVRIAMSVAGAGDQDGVLAKSKSEDGLGTDTPIVSLERSEGKIRAWLGLGADLSQAIRLWSNDALGHKGFMPYGKAFWITRQQAVEFGLGSIEGSEDHIRPYKNGRDLNNRPRNIYVLDFHQKSKAFVQTKYPKAYQHLLENSKPIRAHNNRERRRVNWWRFGEPSTEMREALSRLERFLATTETAPHRIFHFLPQTEAPDQKVRVVALDRSDALTILSSRVHVLFSINKGGWQGAGNDPVYQHTNTFDPFPFPSVDTHVSELGCLMSDLADRLDNLRKQRLAAHNHLTMTGLYNTLERIRELENGADVEPLTDAERDLKDAGHVQILKEIHDDIDRTVLEAYGWSDLTPDLVGKPGATTPSPHKSEEQERAEEELLTRLVALNQERAAEEARGHIRWLRPDFQIPKLAHKAPKPAEQQTEADLMVVEAKTAPNWPSDAFEQLRVVRDLLTRSDAPIEAAQVSAQFKGGRKRLERVETVLARMTEMGIARAELEGDATRYFVPR